MSTFDYAEIARDAKELLTEFGETLQIRSAAPGGTYDTVEDSTVPGGADIDTDFVGVVLAVDQDYSNAVGTENIHERDQLVLMEPGVVVPHLSDTVLIRGVRWQVVNIIEHNPAGTPVLYILQVRV